MIGRRARVAALALAVVGVAAACAVPPPAPLEPAPGSADLRVMTWNVLGAQADAAVFSEHAGWAARVDQLRPDVVVLQEAQAEDVQALDDLPTTGYSVASYVQWECDLKPDKEGVAILVRDGVPVVGSGGVQVGESCTDPTMKRVLGWADLGLPGGTFRVYGTHLTAGTGAAATSRTNQVRAVRATIAAQDPAGGGRWVLAGDLNLSPGGGNYDLLLDGDAATPAPGRLVDTYAEVSPAAADTATCPAVDASDATRLAALLAAPALVRTCGYTAGWAKDDNWLGCDVLSLCTSWELRRDTTVRIRIDDVLRAAGGPVSVTGGLVPNRSDADWAWPGAEWFRLSDHLPYVVDLDVAPEGADR